MLKEHNLLSVAVAAAVVCSLFLIFTAPGAASSPDSSQPGLGRGDHGDLKDLKKVKRWQREHTTTVQVKKIYTYSREKSALSVKTVYTGGRLKEIINSRSGSKTRIFRIKPSRLKEFQGKLGLGKKEFRKLLDQKLVKKDKGMKPLMITTPSDPPNWYEYYKYPQWAWKRTDSGNYENSDPINLAWQGTSWDDSVPLSKVVEEIEMSEPTFAGDLYVYDHYGDGWQKEDKELTDGTLDRNHVRLYSIVEKIWEGHIQIVVGSAHHDSNTHNVTSFESAEDEVAAYFNIYPPIDYDWSVVHDSYDLGNEHAKATNDGWATEISEE